MEQMTAQKRQGNSSIEPNVQRVLQLQNIYMPPESHGFLLSSCPPATDVESQLPCNTDSLGNESAKLTCLTLSKLTALPTPPVGRLFNSFISSISRRYEDTGIKVPVAPARRLSILMHLSRRGKYRAVGTKDATPEII